MATIKIIGLAHGMPTPFDGQYVMEYDPTRPGVDPAGELMIAHLVCTPDPAKALDLPIDEAFELWRKAQGRRADCRPSRPLTAFHVDIS